MSVMTVRRLKRRSEGRRIYSTASPRHNSLHYHFVMIKKEELARMCHVLPAKTNIEFLTDKFCFTFYIILLTIKLAKLKVLN
jgi:hypothetical protein